MRVDWSRWRGLGVTGRVSPRFAHLCGQADAGRRPGRRRRPCPGATPSWRPMPEDRPGLLGTLLRDKVARVLGTSPDRLDGDKPLLQLGIDSLMAVELRNWLEGELQVNLPIVELMRSPSLSGLAELLAERLETAGEAPPRTSAATAPRTSRPTATTATSGCPWRRRRRSCSPASTTSPATRSTPSWPRSWTRKATTSAMTPVHAETQRHDHRTAIAGGPVARREAHAAGAAAPGEGRAIRRGLPALARPARAVVPPPDGPRRARRTTSAIRRGSGRRSTCRRSAAPCRRWSIATPACGRRSRSATASCCSASTRSRPCRSR